jgi:5-hydroxyisourate hydrolase-like protein (transthyretin family)
MTRIARHHLSLFLSLLVLGATSFAQNPAANKANAAVSGRITIEGQPAPGVHVLLKKRDGLVVGSRGMQSPAFTATTDADGRYRIANLAVGAYRISVYAPAHVIEGESRLSYEYGKTVNVAEGAEIENLDFSLTRGGVITGKVSDEYGKPVIAEGVGAFRLDRHGKRDNSAAGDMLRWQTDDRGVYRIFGLEPGRYIVGVGASSEDALLPVGIRGSYKRTYHPDAADESKATVIEVKQGGEVENVDIKLSRATKSYAASGRVIDAETGKPLPGMMIGCDVAKTAGVSVGMDYALTNSNGEFRIESLSPNTYITYVLNSGQGDLYSDRVNFEIVDNDVTGLEIKMVRGASISGVAVIEGVRDPSILTQMSKIQLRAETISQDTAMLMLTLMTGGGVGAINSDGTFRIGGIRPGKTRIVASEPKGFTLARVERNGVEVQELDVAQGEQITGVRLVFTYGTSVLAGRVEIKGGAPPPNAQMTVRVVREGASPEEWWLAKQANVDAQGRFIIEGLSQGNYKTHLMIFTPDADSQPGFPKIEQPVAIADNARQEIALVLDLSKEGAK